MTESRNLGNDSPHTKEHVSGTDRAAHNLLNASCAGMSCGCVTFIVLLVIVFAIPLILMILFGILFTLMGAWESGPTLILEGPALLVGLIPIAIPAIAVLSLLTTVIVGLWVKRLLHKE